MENIYLPKELFTDEFKNFSNQTKLLFSMLLTDSAMLSTAISVDDIISVAQLINILGENRLITLEGGLSEEIRERSVS